MQRRAFTLGLATATSLGAALGIAARVRAQTDMPSPWGATGPFRIETVSGVWTDAAREREVPWLMRLPAAGAPPAPVVVYSHGLGGSRDGGARLSTHLASHGYAVVHLQHLGSDTSIWGGMRPRIDTVDRAALLRRVADPRVSLARFGDAPFAVEQIRGLARDGMEGRLDVARMAMAGHSFGALSTQVAAGQVFPGGGSMPVDAFSAFIAMSPSGDRDGNDRAAFADVRKPFMCLTGTDDSFALNAAVTSAADRLRVYSALPHAVPAMQVVLTGGDHFVFDGRILTGAPRPADVRHQAIIDAGIHAFLDGMLREDRKARSFLREGLARAAGPDALIDWRALPA
jgi:dienelactone hydrolase